MSIKNNYPQNPREPENNENDDNAGEIIEEDDTSFSDISNLPGHADFFRKILNAKGLADLHNKVMTVNWRGYSGNVSPNVLPLQKDDLLKRLLIALDGVNNPTKDELEVLYLYQ